MLLYSKYFCDVGHYSSLSAANCCLCRQQAHYLQNLSRHASPGSIRPFLLLRAGGHHLVVVSREPVSLGEVS